MSKRVSVEEAIAALNELVACDEEAMRALVGDRVECNQSLADHPTAQVRVTGRGFEIGLLGVINAVFGCDESGAGRIFASIDSETGKLLGFKARGPGPIATPEIPSKPSVQLSPGVYELYQGECPLGPGDIGTLISIRQTSTGLVVVPVSSRKEADGVLMREATTGGMVQVALGPMRFVDGE